MVYTSKNISSPVEEKVEDILGNAPSTLTIPRFNTMLESAIFVGSLMEEAYTDLMKDIGIGELAVYESTGAEVLYEAEDGTETEAGKNLKDKASDFFKGLWNKIKKLFEDAIKWFQTKVKEAKAKKMSKIKKVWETKKDSIPDNKTFGKVRFNAADAVINKENQGFSNKAALYINAGRSAMNKLVSGEETDVVAAIKASSNGVDTLANVESAKDIKPAIIKSFGIPEKAEPASKDWVSRNIGKLTSIVEGGIDTSSIKKMYQDLKKEVNAKANEIKKAKADNFKSQAKAVVKVLSFVAAADSAIIDIMRSRYVEANIILTSVAVACKLGKKKEDAKEEAPAKTEQIEDKATQESAIISTIESAFEW